MALIDLTTLVKKLACSQCRGAVASRESGDLLCGSCGKTFRVREGIPFMLDAADESFEQTRYKPGAAGPLSRIKSSLPYRAYLRLMEALTPLDRNHPQRYMPVLAEFLAKRQGNQPWFVLDVGGGDGRYKRHLARRGDAYAILEVDENSERVRDNKGAVQYIIGDAHRIPLRDGQVDFVALTEVLEHVYNPFEVMKECARVLRPGGVIFITTPQYWHIHGWPSDYYRYTVYGLRHLLTTSGFKPVKEIARGGPFTVVSLSMVINFNRFFMFPPVRLLLTIPFMWICSVLDGIFFKDPMRMKNPDTAGWVVIAEKA